MSSITVSVASPLCRSSKSKLTQNSSFGFSLEFDVSRSVIGNITLYPTNDVYETLSPYSGCYRSDGRDDHKNEYHGPPINSPIAGHCLRTFLQTITINRSDLSFPPAKFRDWTLGRERVKSVTCRSIQVYSLSIAEETDRTAHVLPFGFRRSSAYRDDGVVVRPSLSLIRAKAKLGAVETTAHGDRCLDRRTRLSARSIFWEMALSS